MFDVKLANREHAKGGAALQSNDTQTKDHIMLMTCELKMPQFVII